MEVRELADGERGWMRDVLERLWGAPLAARRGAAVELPGLPALVASEGGEVLGLATYLVERGNIEVVTINAFAEGRGVGSALLEGVAAAGRERGCARMWLVTTNDNLRAIGFYLRHGMRIATVHHGAVAAARILKPSIPEVGQYGIPIEDELELERWL